jgi:peptide/nickel transport system substrate-binding protein
LKKLRWQILVVFLALIGIGTLLLSQDASLPLGGEEAEQPVAGGSYSEAIVGMPARLNPLLDYYNQVDYDLDSLIFSGLVKFDERGLPHGDLAETWGISKDGTKYSFSIRNDAVWHDGTPLTSEDIVFTIDLLKNEELPTPDDVRELWTEIEVVALNDKTIQFQLPEAFSPFLDYLSIGILPKHLFEGLSAAEIIASPINLQPVGSGPYRFKDWIVEEDQVVGVELQTFPDYYAEKAFIQDLVFRFYTDASAAMDAFDAGEVEGVGQIPTDLLPRALSNEAMHVFTGRLPKFTLVYLNLDSNKLPFFRDSEVRRALMLGINRTWIINNLLAGQAIKANTPIFPESWAYYSGIQTLEYDPERAIEILKDAGYSFPAEGGPARSKDGVALRFDLLHPPGEYYNALANRIQQDWARLGVVVSLKEVPYSVLIDSYLAPRTYDAALVELDFTRSPDPDPYPFWHQAQITSGQNYSQWDDRQVSEYLEQARVVDDFAERLRWYKNFQVRFASEFPALPLFFPTYSYGVSSKIQGTSMGPLYDPSDRFTNISAWFLQTALQSEEKETSTANP